MAWKMDISDIPEVSSLEYLKNETLNDLDTKYEHGNEIC